MYSIILVLGVFTVSLLSATDHQTDFALQQDVAKALAPFHSMHPTKFTLENDPFSQAMREGFKAGLQARSASSSASEKTTTQYMPITFSSSLAYIRSQQTDTGLSAPPYAPSLSSSHQTQSLSTTNGDDSDEETTYNKKSALSLKRERQRSTSQRYRLKVKQEAIDNKTKLATLETINDGLRSQLSLPPLKKQSNVSQSRPYSPVDPALLEGLNPEDRKKKQNSISQHKRRIRTKEEKEKTLEAIEKLTKDNTTLQQQIEHNKVLESAIQPACTPCIDQVMDIDSQDNVSGSRSQLVLLKTEPFFDNVDDDIFKG